MRKSARWSQRPRRRERMERLKLVQRPEGAPGCPGRDACQGAMEMWFQATPDELEDGYDDAYDFVGVAKLPTALPHLIDPDAIVAKDREAVVFVDYPVEQPVTYALKAENRKGFTRREIVQSISVAYQGIYAAKGNPFGIWGHVIDDLYFGTIHLYRAEGQLWIVPVVGS